MKTVFALFILLAIVVVGGKYGLNYLNNKTLPFGKTPTATINNQTFNVYIAKTPKEKETGLSNKESLPEKYGMFFQFDTPDYYTFWMKKMRFPLDIIFIKNNKVVTVYTNVPYPKSETDNLPVYTPDEPVNAVLELNAGISDKYNIKKGDGIKLSL